MDSQRKTWFITGASQGIGLILVKQLLAVGYNVVATARDLEKLQNAIGVPSPQFLPLQVDLPNEKSVKSAVDSAISHFGSIDVLVNNAGYGLIGGIEESSAQEVQASFDVNVFGLLNVTRAVLPHMRSANSGHIFNLSSVFGLIAGAGWGIYCGTKFTDQEVITIYLFCICAATRNRTFFGDKIYINKEFFEELYNQNNSEILTSVKSVKDQLLTLKQWDSAFNFQYSEAVSAVRQPIESFFNWLIEKNRHIKG